MSTLRYFHDSESDCGYIRVGDGDVARTESLTASLHVDRDGHDDIVGIEVLAVADRNWIPLVTDLLSGTVPDASLVSARFQDIVAANRRRNRTTVPPGTAGAVADERTGDTQVA